MSIWLESVCQATVLSLLLFIILYLIKCLKSVQLTFLKLRTFVEFSHFWGDIYDLHQTSAIGQPWFLNNGHRKTHIGRPLAKTTPHNQTQCTATGADLRDWACTEIILINVQILM